VAEKEPAARRESPKSTATSSQDIGGAQDVGGAQVKWIVGIGASAGGLEAFSELVNALDPTSGMAFVLVQHMSPKHTSLLPELLSAKTSLPVLQIRDGMPLRPDHVFVMPPDVHLTIREGHLRLGSRPTGPAQHNPIDAFLRSLAQWADGHAIGVVLSGTASDGALGLREIKAVGGITMVQDPSTARYEGMPRAAIATDAVDFILSPAAIAVELNRIASLPFMAPRPHIDEGLPTGDAPMQRVYQLLRKASGVDFSQYKQTTITRRLQRRLVLNKIPNLDRYVHFLEENPGEIRFLYEDILIHVTCFFRDPATFQALKEQVLPQVFGRLASGGTARFWVPGCSTGEEAYSLAITALEFAAEHDLEKHVQIFATDISETAIQKARAGSYSEAITQDVSPERLRRYFTRNEGRYRISKLVRESCVFARQDVTRDPPFSKIDLVLCRNLLIYLGTPLQRRLISLFHYALQPSGFLMLGSAETIGPQVELFTPLDKTHRIYVKRLSEQPHSVIATALPIEMPTDSVPVTNHQKEGRSRGPGNLAQEATQLLLASYAPAGVVVDSEFRILQFRGQTSAYLAPAPGDATLQLLKMVREGLLNGTRAALYEARKSGEPVRRKGLPLKSDGRVRMIDVVVIPLANPTDRHFLVLFDERERKTPWSAGAKKKRPLLDRSRLNSRGKSDLISQLQHDLSSGRDFLQSVNQDLEAANEELQSANEEILSNNEELQSANEELDTAKEEMQSTNEELNTVNDELRGRNDELSRANSDLVNLLASVQIAIVILGSDLRIRRFTPMAEKVLNLIPGDVGRPMSDIQPNLDLPDLGALVHEVVETISVQELEVRDRQGKYYSLRIRPYKNLENKIDGAVISLFDIDASVRDKERMQEALVLAEAALAQVSEPIAVIDRELRVERVNPAFLRAFAVSPTDVVGASLLGVAPGRWDVAALRVPIESALKSGRVSESLETTGDLSGVGPCRILVHARPVEDARGSLARLLLVIKSVGMKAVPA
jgi:two-component system CheB/CheR fusion protein